MKQYLGLLRDVRENGVRRPTRAKLLSTGENVDALTVFGRQIRFDLSEGFPLVTTKRVPFDAVAHELIWFLRGDTNVKYLQERGVRIWNEWSSEDGELGPIYGQQWRRSQWIDIKPRQRFLKPLAQKLPARALISPELDPADPLIGQSIESSHGTFRVIRGYRVPRGAASTFTRRTYDVQFLASGYVRRDVPAQAVCKGLIADRYAPTVVGVGCLGEPVDESLRTVLYQTWVGMLKRCYDPNHVGYRNYGGDGQYVTDRWLVFSQFVADVQRLENWTLKLEYPEEYSLDKDFHNANRYGPDVCRWSSALEQSVNTERAQLILATDPAGRDHVAVGLKPLSRDYGLKPASVQACLAGKHQQHHGWRFSRIEPLGGSPRIRIVDQIRQLVADIKHDPNSRRLMLSAWNVGQIADMNLPPCHCMAEFNVMHGKLSCLLLQRSADCFLGVPFNIASYALLTHLVAHVTGLALGEFVHTFGDAHIYCNHLDQVDEQLSREPLPLSRVEIAPEVSDVTLVERSQLVLHDYRYHPTLKGEVAV